MKECQGFNWVESATSADLLPGAAPESQVGGLQPIPRQRHHLWPSSGTAWDCSCKAELSPRSLPSAEKGHIAHADYSLGPCHHPLLFLPGKQTAAHQVCWEEPTRSRGGDSEGSPECLLASLALHSLLGPRVLRWKSTVQRYLHLWGKDSFFFFN